ncbi:MAG TPA: hypothetical protein VFT72_12760 [Opitutaceae bacterium]|nr:hypothetical protein [Opitutaceae bacterium]
MQLQPLATTCFVSGETFVEGNRVASFLIRAANGEITRYDLLETSVPNFAVEGTVACRWVHVFKPKKTNENPDRELKLTAESLFLTLADPSTELTEESTRLVQFLALMLERKRVLRSKGLNAARTKNIFEHAKTKQLFEVPAGEFTPEFFVQVQEQLSVLVGSKPEKPTAPQSAPAAGGEESPQGT